MNKQQDPLAGNWIEEESFRRIEEEVPEPRPFSGQEWTVVRRMIHASADFDLLSLTCFHSRAVQAGKEALSRGATIVADTEMTRAGLTSARLERLGCKALCYLNSQQVKEWAAHGEKTRSELAMEAAAQDAAEAVYVIGNAPTALQALLDLCREGGINPPLIIGMPVGFVGAAEAKQGLEERSLLPFITLRGRKGGSAIAASCLNALAELALGEKPEQSGNEPQ